MQKILNFFRKYIIPKPIFEFFQPFYHYLLVLIGAIIYKFPGKKILVIGVTGTKGKTTTVEMINAIFEAAGKKTAVLSTLHFKIGEKDQRNLYKMTMPGRFFVQKFLRDAVNAKCEVAIIEMTSEGAKQFRHKWTFLDALIFLNLAPEHIESHGSYENYVNAKLSIAKELEKNYQKKVWPSPTLKSDEEIRGLFGDNFSPAIIANSDDKEGEKFLALNITNKIPYSLKDAFNIHADENGASFQIDKTVIYMKLPGVFNIYNALGAVACAKHFGIPLDIIKKGLESIEKVRGRMEKIDNNLGIEIVVDYAHTPDSLKAIYEVYTDHHTICILGNTGGGRDTWKRPEMGKIADEYCDQIILTNEDPYDEDPMKIVEEMKVGIKNKPCEIIIDRRDAIYTALTLAKKRASHSTEVPQDKKIAVLITGKGTDPYIMSPNGSRQKWDDASVVLEELHRIMNNE